MKSNKIKKIGVLLVFSIFVSLISFNMAWAESKTFYFVLNDYDNWTYTLGRSEDGSFNVDINDQGITHVNELTDFSADIQFQLSSGEKYGILFDELQIDWSLTSMYFNNGVPTSVGHTKDFRIVARNEITYPYDFILELIQGKEGTKEENFWTLDGTVDSEEVHAEGNWFFIPKEYVEWSGAPGTPKIPRYDTAILTNVNNMVDFTPIPGPYLTIPFTEDYPPCTCGCPDTSVALFGFGAELHNKSCTSLTNLTVNVRTLTNENLLLLARGGEAYPEDYAGAETGGEGVLWTLPLPPSGSYFDGTLGPDEYTIVVFAICLEERVPFRFYVDLLGEMQ